ncbi:MAG: hypothetical protein IPL61_01215 [Myxococcales bacterium]|nr:hypothetical protein [Myxococcales bacterium]
MAGKSRRPAPPPVRRQLALPVSTSPLRGAILTIADALCDQDIPVPALTNRGFAEKFGSPSHGLDDVALARLLAEYVDRGMLRWRGRAEHLLGRPDVIGLTPAGGAAWEAARSPDWERYVDITLRETKDDWRLEVRSPSKDAAFSYLTAGEAGALHVLTGRPRWKKVPRAAVLPWRKMSVWVGRVSCRIPALAPDPVRFTKQFAGWRSARDLRSA